MMDINHCTVHKLGKVCLLYRYRISTSLRHLEIYRGQPEILEYLSEHGDCSQTETANELGVSSASVAVSIKRMCKAGLIERSVDEDDRRINRLRITEKGRKVLALGKSECSKINSAMFSGFSEDEMNEFSSMLKRIIDNLSCGEISSKELFNMIKNNDEDIRGNDKC